MEVTTPNTGMCSGIWGSGTGEADRKLLSNDLLIGGAPLDDQTYEECKVACDSYSDDCRGFSWGAPPPQSPPSPGETQDRRRNLLQASGELGTCFMFSIEPTSTVSSSFSGAGCYAVGEQRITYLLLSYMLQYVYLPTCYRTYRHVWTHFN